MHIIPHTTTMMSHKRAWDAGDGGTMTWWAFKNAMKVGAAHGYAAEADAIAASFGLRPPSERHSSGGTLQVDGGDSIVVGAYDVTVLGALHTALVGASFWLVRFDRSRSYEGAPLESNERVAQRVVCGGVGVDDRGIYMDTVGGARMHLFLAPPLAGVRLNVDHTEALTARVEYGTTILEQSICPQAQEKRARDAPWKMFLVIPQASFMRRDELSQALRATPASAAPSSASSTSSSRPAKKAKPELTVLRPEGMADRVRKHRDDKKPAPPEAWDALSGEDQLETARSFFRDLAAACEAPPQASSVAEKVHIISILAPFVEHMTKAGGGGLEAVKMHPKVQKCLRGNGLYPHALQAMFSDTPTQQQIERFRENYKTHWTPPTADDMAFLIRRRKLCMTDISAGRDVEIAAQFRFNAGKRYSGASDDKKDHISMLGMRDSGEAKRYAGLLKRMYREQWKKHMAKFKAEEAKGRATAQQQKRAAAAKGKGVRPTDPDELCTWMKWVLKAAHKRYGRHKYVLDKWDFVFEHVYRKWNKDYGTAHSSATDTLFLTLLGQDQSWILNDGIRRLDRPSPAHDDGLLQAAEILQRYNHVLSDELRAQLRASSGMVVEIPASVALPPVQARVVVDTQVKNKRLVQRCAWDAYLHFARSVDAACPQEFCSIGMFARVLERGWYRRNRRQLAALPEAISAALLDDALRHSVDNYVEHATIGTEAMAGLRAALAVCRSMMSQAAEDEDSGAYSVERAKRQGAIIAAIRAALSDVSKAESFHSKPFVLGELRWPDYIPVLHMIQTAQTDPGVMANVVKLLTAVTAKTLSGAEPSSDAPRPEEDEHDDEAPPPWREDVEEKSTRSVKVGKETDAWLAAWKSMFRANKNTP